MHGCNVLPSWRAEAQQQQQQQPEQHQQRQRLQRVFSLTHCGYLLISLSLRAWWSLCVCKLARRPRGRMATTTYTNDSYGGGGSSKHFRSRISRAPVNTCGSHFQFGKPLSLSLSIYESLKGKKCKERGRKNLCLYALPLGMPNTCPASLPFCSSIPS